MVRLQSAGTLTAVTVACGVLGGRGYLGSQFAALAVQDSEPLHVLRYARDEGEFRDLERTDRLDALLNLGSPNEVVARLGGPTLREAIDTWEQALVRALHRGRPRALVHVSTYHILGDPDGVVDDDATIQGGNVYGDAHLECIEIARTITTRLGIPMVCVIPTNIYGSVRSDLVPRVELILNLALQNMRQGTPLSLRSDGNGSRDFLWIGDAMRALIQIVRRAEGLEGNFLLAAERTCTVKEALQVLFAKLGEGEFAEWCTFGKISESPLTFRFECSRLRTVLDDWRPLDLSAAAIILRNQSVSSPDNGDDRR